MTEMQLRFVDAFVALRKGAPAARRAGYSKEAAKQQAHQLLQSEEVRAAIAERFSSMVMTIEEAVNDLSDVARTRLNDYMKVKEVLKTPTVRKSLRQVINELDAEIEFENEFARVAKLSGDELRAHEADQKRREIKGIRYALELERNPQAYRDVPGESVWVEDVYVDLVALAKAKKQGRIKKIKFEEHGPMVEMYPADSALSKILEFHGKLNAPGSGSVTFNFTPEAIANFKAVFNEKYK